MTRRNRRTAVSFLGLLLMTVALLGACSGSSEDPATGGGGTTVPSVASVPSAGSSTTSAPPAPSEGPLIRADTSTQERERFDRAYAACLESQGVPLTRQSKIRGVGALDPADAPKYASQIAACQSKKPEQIADRFKREHPQEFRDRLQKFIACMKAHGSPIIYIAPDGWGVSDADAATVQLDDATIDTCETKAYGL